VNSTPRTFHGIEYGLSNGRQDNEVRLIIHRAYGFHSAESALATVTLS
jgi:hypothetical protein